MSACGNHDAEACCTECPDHAATDGLGFPHPAEAEKVGRRALQRCSLCRRLVGRDKWIHDPRRAFFGCSRCRRRALKGQA